MIQRRNLDLLCGQETKVKGNQGLEHWMWIQVVLCWCRQEEKWGGGNLEGSLCEESY